MKSLRQNQSAVVAAALVLSFAMGAAAQDDIQFEDQVPARPMSAFQWSLVHGGSWILAPSEGRYYPAKLAGSRVLESYPPKIEVELYHQARGMTPELHTVKSAREISPSGWIAEVWQGDSWVPAQTFVFDQQFFFVRTTPGKLDRVAAEDIRFLQREN